ncbi:immunity-related GTPase family M protein-like [Acomys russatus]|uniref:immunity-related GTPase family M protein-like n=1 Tax=Acomys russatus TaxID=60746 RepID=UPI0021E3150A|nr:immunity-related GTPase family M protein-like [Acomys russatus]
MDSLMTLPYKAWKTFTFLISMAKSLISPSSKSIADGESFYSSQVSFSQEITEKIARAVMEGKLPKAVLIVKDEMQRMSTYPVKIAVTGDSGNGMSSFINALRNIGHEEEDSAPTGVVRTTEKPACYYSNFPNVELWDLPGTGTTAQSMEDYIDEMQFDTYDLVIIIASEQFSSNHVKLAKAMQSMRKRFYVVWTKLDRDLSTSALAEPQLLQSIQRNIQENLQKEEVREPPTFLVSNFTPFFHDFPKLRNTLQRDISNIRYRDPLETLSQICDMSISDKAISLKGQILPKHLDTVDLEESLETYQKLFGVDDLVRQQVVQSTGTLALSRTMQCQDVVKMSRMLGLMTSLPVTMVLTFLAHRWWWGLWNFAIRFFRHQRCKLIIGVVAKNTKTSLRRALKDYTLPPEIHTPSSAIQAASGASFCLVP